MACVVNLQITTYNSETKKLEILPIPIATNIGEDQHVSLDDVVEYIANQPPAIRLSLANQLIHASSQKITATMLKNHQFVSNTTIDEILSTFPSLQQIYKPSSDLSTKYVIVRAADFVLNNKHYNGRVLMADGREMFIIKDQYSAENFIRYLQAKEAATQIFQGGEIPESIAPLMEDLEIIAKHRRSSVLDTVIGFLNNKNDYTASKFQNTEGYTPFSYTDKNTKRERIITPRQVLSKVTSALIGEYNIDDNYTDLELAIRDNATVNKNYNWVINKRELYNILSTYYPQLKIQYKTFEEFDKLNKDELQNTLVGENGLFVGHPKLQRAEIKKTELGTIKEVKSNKKVEETKTIGADVIQANWSEVLFQAQSKGKNKRFPTSYEVFLEKDLESRVRLFNNANFHYTTEETGETYKVKASIVTNDQGEKEIKYSYTYKSPETQEVTLQTLVSGKVTLTFPYSSIGETYKFGYDTESIFSPVNSERVQGGKYNGMYLYKAVMPNGREIYAISRSVISPNSYMDTYPTEDAAIAGIDKKFREDKIGENSLISIKQESSSRRVQLELRNVSEGQIVSVLQLSLPSSIRVEEFSSVLKQLMSFTVPKFQQELSSVNNIEKLNTPEKAAAFIILVHDAIKNATVQNLNTISSLAELLYEQYRNETAQIIDKIDSAPTIHYFIEKLTSSKKNAKGSQMRLATVRALGGEEMALIDESWRGGSEKVKNYLEQSLNGAIRLISEQYGIIVHTVTTSDLESSEGPYAKLGLAGKAASTKAFIYNGEIYFNTSNAKISDLYHEIAHLFFGVLKVKDPEQYNRIINYYRNSKGLGYSSRYRYMLKAYENFARQDIIEETVASLIGDRLMRDLNLDTQIMAIGESKDSPITGGALQLVETITKIITSNKADKIDNELGFDAALKALSSDSELQSKLARQRACTNFIQQMITEKKITESC